MKTTEAHVLQKGDGILKSLETSGFKIRVMEVYKFYEIQKYMTLTRHVYSPHINVASLNWFNRLPEADQAMIFGIWPGYAGGIRQGLLSKKQIPVRQPFVDRLPQRVSQLLKNSFQGVWQPQCQRWKISNHKYHQHGHEYKRQGID
ncbi:MAG: hypothetical protein RQ739_02235 [Desulfotignum sp.]|nr:hypothetical protein [Desulfotignum sp.]